MRQFFKFMTASCLGTIIALGVVILFFTVFGMVLATFDGGKTEVKPNSVLTLQFDGYLPEHTNNTVGEGFRINEDAYVGVHDAIALIERAAEDPNIKGIVIDKGLPPAGFASARLIREALNEFKASDKFVLAYGDYFGQGSYYFSSVADHIILNPIGYVDMRGFAAILPFLTQALDNLGIDMKIYYAGDFKSATEPFRRNNMSEANKLQTREFLEEIFELYLQDIATNRPMSLEQLKSIPRELKSKTAQDAIDLQLVDQLGDRLDFEKLIREKLELKEGKSINYISIIDYYSYKTPASKRGKKKVAVVYAEGEISDENKEPGTIHGDTYVKTLEKLANKDNIHAVVLRVNSPGGSILASDKIWEAVQLIKDAGKPVIASFGDLAASGGYYISCGADSIFTQTNTLTGSIGVFMMVPNFNRMFNDKLNIPFDSVQTDPYAANFTAVFPWGEVEDRTFQASTQRYYQQFLDRVSNGRGMDTEQAEKVAKGRVWTGSKAVELGLADRIGGLEEAIASAASLAELEDYGVAYYPHIKDPWMRLFEEITGEEIKIQDRLIKAKLGEHYAKVKQLEFFANNTEVPLARLPFELKWN